MVISSLTNPKIVEVTKLYDKKYRRLTNRYVIEGARLVTDAIKHGAKLVSLYVRESNAQDYDFAFLDSDIQTVVSDKVFAKMCDTVNSQGVLAVVERSESELTKPTGNCLVLDGLQDPGNVGTLIRCAVACGFTDIYAVNTVDLYSPKVIRSAMSAHFCVKLHELDSIEQAFSLLENVQTVSAHMEGENVFSAQFSKRVALILGNEGNGLSDFSLKHSTKTVALPMENGFESLNVAVAGSVIMYQIYSQNSNMRR
ncbi:MAG: RNA methyltransferase [Clostridiales bacterium]|nr:RNA methyltransferase [Clostridiales bacterium]